MDSRFLFIRLPDDAVVHRGWNGNDETGERRKGMGIAWHGFIPAKDNPVDIALSWRTKKTAPQRHVGTYRLHLTELLKAGYINTENGKDGVGFRVMFVHAENDCIYLQRDAHSRLIVGILE